jgi:hypothetical protein
MFNQTLSGIFGCIYKNTGDFWLAVDEDGEVASLCDGPRCHEVDNQLTYWLSQAFVDKSVRGSKTVKGFWQKMRAQAVQVFLQAHCCGFGAWNGSVLPLPGERLA